MNKIILSTVLLVSISSCGDGATKSDSADNLSGGRPIIASEDIEIFGDMCPKAENIDGVSTKYGHTLVLVDTTSGFGEEQFTLMDRLIFGSKKLQETPPYDRLSILQLDGIEIQASENKYIFSKCRPRNGQENSPYIIDRGSYFDPVGPMKTNWAIFLSSLEEATDILKVESKGTYTQLFEQVVEISRIPDLQFDASYKTRKLIIVSDLQQHSGNVKFTCGKNKCKSWGSLNKDSKINSWLVAFRPDFGSTPIEVEIIFLNARADPKLTKGLKEIWIDYFADMGINNIHFEYDTSTVKNN